MPADPIDFRILQNLRDALKLITVAGGYHFTVAATAVKLDPNHDVEALIAPSGPRPFIVLQLGDEDWNFNYGASQVIVTLPFTVHWVSDAVATDDESRLKTFFKGCADVEKAITVDQGRGGLAIETRIAGRRLDLTVDGSQVWAMVDGRIRREHTYGSPNG